MLSPGAKPRRAMLDPPHAPASRLRVRAWPRPDGRSRRAGSADRTVLAIRGTMRPRATCLPVNQERGHGDAREDTRPPVTESGAARRRRLRQDPRQGSPCARHRTPAGVRFYSEYLLYLLIGGSLRTPRPTRGIGRPGCAQVTRPMSSSPKWLRPLTAVNASLPARCARALTAAPVLGFSTVMKG
jgi:hypothetical protein